MQSVLDGSADLSESQLRALASEYKRVCDNTARKLVHCAALIRAGRDYVALQVAETEPMLLESLNELVFAQLDDWRNYCGANSLLCPPPFDEHQMDLVRSLYTREISQNHPLYRDYRRAMRVKDYDTALSVIRTISKVNNANIEAKNECEKLQKTISLRKFEEIQDALEAKDEKRAMELAIAIKDFADDYLANEKVWNDIKVKIDEYERQKSQARILEIVKELKALQDSEDFSKILALGAEYDILSNTLSLKKDGEDFEFIKAQMSRASKLQEEKFIQETKAQACVELAAEIEHPNNENLSHALSKILDLKKKAGDLLENELNKKVQKRIAILRSKIALKRTFYTALCVVVLAGAGGVALKLEQNRKELQTRSMANSDLIVMKQAQSIDALEAQISAFEKAYPKLLENTDFTNSLAAEKANLENQKQILANILSLISNEKLLEDIERLDALKNAEKDLLSLMPSDALKLKAQLANTKQTLEKQIELSKNEYRITLKNSLDAMQNLLSNADIFSDEGVDINAIDTLLEKALKIVNLPQNVFVSNMSDAETLSELQTKFEELKKNIDALDSAKKSMKSATNSDEYLSALEEFASLQILPRKLAESARKILEQKDLISNSVYMNICDAKTANALPETLSKKLIDFPTGTFEIYENVLKGEMVYTLGTVEESSRKWRGGGETTQVAQVISQTGEAHKKSFSRTYTEGGRIIGSLLSKTSLTKESKLGKEAVETSISESPLKSMNLIIKSDAHPMFKLWLEAEFLRELKKDSVKTGFVFSESLQKRADKVLKNATGIDAYSWIFASSTRTNFIKNELYSEVVPDFYEEANSKLALAREVVKNPLKFVGFVDKTLQVEKSTNAKTLFGLDKKYEFSSSENVDDFAKFTPIFVKPTQKAE